MNHLVLTATRVWLGFEPPELAALAGSSRRIAYYWESGDTPVPSYIAHLMRELTKIRESMYRKTLKHQRLRVFTTLAEYHQATGVNCVVRWRLSNSIAYQRYATEPNIELVGFENPTGFKHQWPNPVIYDAAYFKSLLLEAKQAH